MQLFDVSESDADAVGTAIVTRLRTTCCLNWPRPKPRVQAIRRAQLDAKNRAAHLNTEAAEGSGGSSSATGVVSPNAGASSAALESQEGGGGGGGGRRRPGVAVGHEVGVLPRLTGSDDAVEAPQVEEVATMW